MDIKEIISLKNAKPFVPFVCIMGDGREFEVSHPDFMARSPLGRSVTVYDALGVHHLDVRRIAELRHAETPSQPD